VKNFVELSAEIQAIMIKTGNFPGQFFCTGPAIRLKLFHLLTIYTHDAIPDIGLPAHFKEALKIE